MNQLMSIEAASEMIRRGLPLSVAGPEAVLDRLPQGQWIGGTIPYFMVEEGGVVVQDERLFVTDLSGLGQVGADRLVPGLKLRLGLGDGLTHRIGLAIQLRRAGGILGGRERGVLKAAEREECHGCKGQGK